MNPNDTGIAMRQEGGQSETGLSIAPEVEAAIATRRSVRGFTAEAVPRAVVEHILALPHSRVD